MIKVVTSITLLVVILTIMMPAGAESGADDPQQKEAIDLMKKGKYADASKVLEHAVEQAPLSAPTHMLYGESLFLMGKFLEAASEFKQARNIQPSEPRYGLRCAEAYLAAGKTDDAVQQCDQALAQCKDEFFKKALENLKKQALHPRVRPPINDPEQPQRSQKTGGTRK